MWEARLTQFVLPVFLFSGHMLPVIGTLLGFLFFAAATVILAKWYALPQKKLVWVIFSLLIVLHPYVCSQLYYAHSVVSVFAWHFCSVAGVVFLWDFIDNKRFLLLLAGCLLLLIALCGYAACIELMLTIAVGKFLSDVSALKRISITFVKKYFYFFGLISVSFGVYAGIIFGLKKIGVINVGMYNTQSLPLLGVLHKISVDWYRPFDVLTTALPYSSWLSAVCIIACFLLCLCTVRENKILCVGGIVCLIYAMFCVAYISPQDVFRMFRVHSYSVPYFAAILFALVWQNGKKIHKNIIFALGVMLIFLFVKADVTAQKIWYLGNVQDEAIVERMKKDLLPELKKGMHYRLSTIGNLYGRQKFAGVRFVSDEKRETYKEYWGAPYFLAILFSAGFWAYEAENPIWGDAMYIGDSVFYGTSNENIYLENIITAGIFAMYFGDDKKELNLRLRKLKPFPQKPYYTIGGKDIFLMMENNNSNKVKLFDKMQNESAH